MKEVDYLIIGAGPTGLAAGYQLKKHDISSFLILEASDTVGGLSASYKDLQGFSWDVGGHVLFSSIEPFSRLMNELMEKDLIRHRRRARVRILNQWTDYPFQNHLHQLESDLARRCQEDLNRAPGPGKRTHSFKDWIHHSFGDTIAALFMEPYNQKVWTYPLQYMGCQWVEERISPGRREQTLVCASSSDVTRWGPNHHFYYPVNGGMGAVFRRLAGRLDGHVRLKHKVVSVAMDKQVAITANGKQYHYKSLLSTAPLDGLSNGSSVPTGRIS